MGQNFTLQKSLRGWNPVIAQLDYFTSINELGK